MKKILIYIPFILAGVSGCMVGPRLEKPDIDTPEAYRFDSIEGDSLANLAWWELFGDEILDTLISIALLNNRNVQIASLRILEAEAVVGFNRADIYPNFGYKGSALRQVPDPTFQSTGAGNLFSFGPNVFWELDFWGKYRHATQAARAELMASHYGQQSIMISLISGVAGSYFLLLDYNARLEISHRTWGTRKDALNIIQARYDKGIIPEIDLNQAQIQEAIAAAAVPLFQRLVAQTEHALSVLIGVNPGAVDRGSPFDLIDSPDIPAGIPSGLLARRPDILAAEQQFYAQTSRIGVAQAMVPPPIFALTPEVISPERLGLGFGIISTCLNLGIVVGPAAAGLLKDVTGSYQASYALMSGFALMITLLMIISRRRHNQTPPTMC